MAAAGLFVLRLALAFVLVSHGGHVLFGLGAGGGLGPGGLGTAAEHYTKAGLEPGMLMAIIVGVVQLVAGVLVGLGLMSRWASLAAACLTAMLLWKEQAPWGLYINWVNDPTRGNGIEFSLVLIAALVCIFLIGPGEWSFDGRRAYSVQSRAAGRARLRYRG
jgi:putative oxidoreductase